LCIGDFLALEDNVTMSSNTHIAWSVTGDTTTYISINQSGDYYVVNTNACGADTSNHIQVISLSLQGPTVSLNGFISDTLCYSSPGIILTGTPLGGVLLLDGFDTLTNGSLFYASTIPVGSYSFSYYYADSNGCSNSATQYETIDSSCTDSALAVRNIAGNTVSFSVYPNPASDLINIKADGLTGGNHTLSLNNIDGQVVNMQQINVTGNILNTQLNIQNLPTGIYFLSLSSETVRETIKVVKY